ncbi:hypothetical protein ACGTN9_01245 [Halobacillus sp. MO56]
MKNKISNIFANLYGWIAFLTMALGLLTALMFGASFIIGGGSGEAIAVLAGKMMSWGIRFAAIAMVVGIVHTYASKEHSLTLKSESKQAAEKEINNAKIEKAM